MLALAALAAGSGAASASAAAPWEQAEEVRAGLFEAQTDLLLDGGEEASLRVEGAEAAITGRLERELAASSPGSLRELRDAVADAANAAAAGNEAALAAARGRALAAIRRGAFAVAVDATRAGDTERARGWLLIRDFRQATRFTRPGVDATTALDELEAGETSADEAVTAVRKDLLDAYQARLVTYIDDATQASDRGFAPAFAENAAIAAGYWPLLAPEFEEVRGPERSRDGRSRLRADGGRCGARRRCGVHRRPRPRARRRRRLHRRAAHPRRAGAPRAAADPVPRPDPCRIRPRDRGRRGHARLRDPGGGRFQRGSEVGLHRPRGDPRGARPRWRRHDRGRAR